MSIHRVLSPRVGFGRHFVSLALTAVVGALVSCPSRVEAGITFSGSVAGTGGTNSATAYFQQDATDLTSLLLTITNTRTTDVTHQVDVLTAVFFDLVNAAGNTISTLVLQDVDATGIYQQNSSVNTNANGSLVSLSVPNLAAPESTNGGPGNFKGGWQYRMTTDSDGLAGLPGDQNHGVGTNGLGIFNGKVRNTDERDYGLTAAGDNVATSQAKQMFNYPLIKNSLVLTFNGLPTGFLISTSNLTNVRFQYGTGLSEPSFTVPTGIPDVVVPDDDDDVPGGSAPEPGSLLVFATLFAGLGGGASWRRRKQSA
ncbi:MAG: XDD4 family exosortase-dependent surface protein [Planctomycetaceae bacterium]